MEKIRYGIIGLGNQGTKYLRELFAKGKIENGRVTAACDINKEKIERMKAGIAANEQTAGYDRDIVYFEDYIKMLDSGLCDAVLIEVPHYLHPEMAMECFKRGIHVILEKPAGVYTKQVKEMNESAKKTGSHFGMMFNQRTNCIYRKMREMVKDGSIGKVMRVTWIITDWFRTQQYYNSGSWRGTWEGEGGGVLFNQCPHQIDLLGWVVGEQPSSVNAFCHFGKWHDIEVEDDVTAYLEYKSGATGVFITTTAEAAGTNRFEISGTCGKLVCENNKLYYTKLLEDGEAARLATSGTHNIPRECGEVETDGLNRQHEGIINNFTNALLGLEDFFVDGTEGINEVELMDAMELSGWKGGAKVTLPIDDDEYLRELEKRRKTSRYIPE